MIPALKILKNINLRTGDMLTRVIVGLLFLLSFAKSVLADPVTVEIPPEPPQVRENFSLRFKIKTNSSSKPQISFNSDGIDILSQRSEGVSIQTAIINGKFTSRRELVYAYEMNAPKPGTFKISDIKIQLGDKTFGHQDMQISILPQRRVFGDVFIEAEVSKKEVFVGEGIDVRYYLYTKLPIVGIEVKKFPSLNKMIKRFHHINENQETVNYKGQIYRRSLKYSARVYPEIPGEIYIDPLELRIQYRQERGNNPFGGFGFSFGRLFTKTLSSKMVPLNVRPLPKGNVPAHFTGLIGKHEFKVEQGKDKYLINEAIELRMEVNGPGALENFEAPLLYDDDKLEKFDVKSEVIETGKSTAKKIFDYTYLARSPVNQGPFSVKLSYFDPQDFKYETVEVSLPGLQISGVAIAGRQEESLGLKISPAQKNQEEHEETTIVAPVFELSYGDTLKASMTKWLMLAFFILILIQLTELGASQGLFSKRKIRSERDLYREIQKKGLTYSRLYALLSLLNPEEANLKLLINNSSLKRPSKEYFFYLIYSLEKKSFGGKDIGSKLHIKRNYFKDLLEVINRERNQKTV